MSVYTDKKLACRDCNVQFSWTAGEQEFFASKGFNNPPTRCPECRKKNRGQGGGKGPKSVGSQDQNQNLIDIKCKSCAKVSQANFTPKNPHDLLCAECFEKTNKAA